MTDCGGMLIRNSAAECAIVTGQAGEEGIGTHYKDEALW